MKRCPACRKDYLDDSLLYCLDDGSALVQGIVTDEPATAIIPTVALSSANDSARSRSCDETVILRSAASTCGTVRRPFVGIVAAAIVLIAFGAAGIFAYLYYRPASMLPDYEKLTFRRGSIGHARFGPEGQSLVYSAAWNGNPSEIYSTRSGMTESQSLGESIADVLAVSSAGELAVLIKPRIYDQLPVVGTLARMPMIGGTPREVLEDVQEADWSPDGKELAVVHYVDKHNRLEYPIGKVLYETAGYISSPRISPRGDRIAFLNHKFRYDNRGTVEVVDLAGNRTTLTEEMSGTTAAAWSKDGDEVWFSGTRTGEDYCLYAASLSGQTRSVLSVPGDLTIDDIARDGRVLLTHGRGSTELMGLAPGETVERNLSWLDSGWLDDISADGKSFAFEYSRKGSGNNYSTYLFKTDGSPPVRLGEGSGQALSPDGKWLITLKPTPSELWLLPTGAGEARAIGRFDIEQYSEAHWLPDGKQIVFVAHQAGHQDRVYVQPIDGGGPRSLTPEGVSMPLLVSPNGQFLIASEMARSRYLIYPIAGAAEPREVIGLDPSEEIMAWCADSRSVYVCPNRGQTLKISISRLDVNSGRKEFFKKVEPADKAGMSPPFMRLTPDGKSYVYQVHRTLMDLYLVNGLK
jgi:eukaryotic-like serine/threonine-protein kinase